MTFEHFYDEEVWTVYGFFAYRVASRAEAEDLTQAVFERALRAWSRFDPARASARTWVMAIAHNLLVDHYRRDRSGREVAIGEGGVDEDALGSVEPQPDLGLDPALGTALARLSPREREILALRFGADLSGPEIAESLGLSLANVQQICSRALRRLRAELEG